MSATNSELDDDETPVERTPKEEESRLPVDS